MKNTDFMNLSLPEGTDKIDIEILNSDFTAIENLLKQHAITETMTLNGEGVIIGAIGPYIRLQNIDTVQVSIDIGNETYTLASGENVIIRETAENIGIITSGNVHITYFVNPKTYADKEFYTKEKVDELLSNVEATVEVDSELSETSENPVQNKVITAELASYATITTELTNNLTEIREFFKKPLESITAINKFIRIDSGSGYGTFEETSNAQTLTYIFGVEPNKKYHLVPTSDVSTFRYIQSGKTPEEMITTSGYQYTKVYMSSSAPESEVEFETLSDIKSIAIYCGTNASFEVYEIIDETRARVDNLEKFISSDTQVSVDVEVQGFYMAKRQESGVYAFFEASSDNASVYRFKCDTDMSFKCENATTFRLAYSTKPLEIATNVTITEKEGFIANGGVIDDYYYFEKPETANYVYIYIGNKEGKSIKAYTNNLDIEISKRTGEVKFNVLGLSPSVSIPETATEYFALWEKFVIDGFATKTTLCTVENLPVNMYTFKASRKWTYDVSDAFTIVDDDTLYQRPQVLLDSGIHGNEKASPLWLYEFVRKLCYDRNYTDILNAVDLYVVPLVNPTGYNNNSRYNYQNIDINRDLTDFQSQEATALKSVLDARHYDIYFDIHQLGAAGQSNITPDICTTVAVPYGTEQSKKNSIYSTFIQAGAYADKVMSDFTGKAVSQSVFPWRANNNNTFRNYAKDKADIVACFEFTKYCYKYSGTDAEYNEVSMLFGNIVLDEALKRFFKKLS